MKQQKLLYLSQLYPYPPDSGGKIKTLNTMKALASQYDIYAVFISEEKPHTQAVKELTKLGIQVKLFYSDKILASVKDDLWDLFLHFIRGTPHYVFQYTYDPAFGEISKIIRIFQPDIIHVDHLNMAQYLPKEKHEKRILEHHNVETYLYWTRFYHTTKPARKIYLAIEMVLTYLFERRALRLFDHIFAISEPEKDRLQKIFHVTPVTTQPIVYPANPVIHRKHIRPSILFVGTLGWPPNEDAMEWFLRSMFPDIVRTLPNVELHVVGRLAPRYHIQSGNNIFVHGFQKDLRPFFETADVFILPFRMGGGLRLKSLTAMAAGIPIVTTPLGVEGLNIQNGKECFIAQTGEDFSQDVVRALRSNRVRETLSRNALRYIKEHHNVRRNQEFLKVYRSVTE